MALPSQVQPTKVKSTTGQELPSISNYFKDPQNQKILIIISLVLNGLLFLGLIASLGSGSGSNNNGIGPTALPTPTKPVVPRDTIGPTENPSEQLSRLQDCFVNCTDEDFFKTLDEELSKIDHVKVAYTRNDNTSDKCYGIYMEASSPDKQFESSFRPLDCANYELQPRQIVIGNRAYIYSGNTDTWDSATVSPLVRTKLLETKDLIAEQQTITSEYEEINGNQIRSFTGTSRIVNDFNQVINKKVVVKVNEEYEIIYFMDEESSLYTEEGSYFDYGIENSIKQL